MDRRDCTGKIVSRSSQTMADYTKRYHGLRARAEQKLGRQCNLADVAAWFCSLTHDGEWEPSTIRKYAAAIWHRAEEEAGVCDLREVVADFLSRKPLPRTEGPKRTSAKKRKTLPKDEYNTLMAYLAKGHRKDDRLILGYLMFNIALFLRPIEYGSARIEYDGARPGDASPAVLLVVQNAKATNGRANGKVRKRDLSQCDPEFIRALELYLKTFQKALSAAESWKALQDRLASRLARVCEILDIDRVSFYTLRHVGMSTAKRSMTPIEVAAAAGHASVRTAMSHYAKRRTGWRLSRAFAGKPTPDSIARVRGEPRTFRPAAPGMGQGMP